MIVAGSFGHRSLFAMVTLFTDFGTTDGYVAAVKGVLASRVAGVQIIDATHEIEPGDIASGAHAIRRYWNRYPPGTVHLAVVDPGVGSDRRALAARADDVFLVAPDNGLISLVLEDARTSTVVEITNRELVPVSASRTFHARDVFAPAAAHLLAGRDLRMLGPEVSDWVRLSVPAPTIDRTTVSGVVVTVDRFGNLQTNIGASAVTPGSLVLLDRREIGVIAGTYSDVPSNAPVALINSDGFLEIAIRDGSAARVLEARIGTPVTVLADG